MSGRDDPPRGTHRGLRRAALTTLGIAIILGVILLRPGGRVQADTTEHVVFDSFIENVRPGTTVTQPFRAGADGLSEVTIRVGTYGEHSDCGVRIELLDDHDNVQLDRFRPCSTISDAEPLSTRFTPIPDSSGRTYRVRLTADPNASHDVAFAAGEARYLPPATSDGGPVGKALELHSGYGDDRFAAQQVMQALHRLEQYGPFWAKPWFVIGLAVVCVACLVALAVWGDRRWHALVLLLVLALAKGVLWATVIPAFEGVDEPAHFSYAQFMAEDHRIPKRDFNFENRETTSADLTQTLDVVHRDAQPPGDRPDFSNGSVGPDKALLNGQLDRHAGGNGLAAGYTPAYYVVPALLEHGSGSALDRLDRMRLWSVALGLVTVLGASMLGWRIFSRHRFAPMLFALAVLAQPMLSQQTAIVNNDALIIAAGPFCLLAIIELTNPLRNRWMPLLAGLAIGIAMLGKPVAAAWFVVLALACFIGWRRGARWWHTVVSALGGVLVAYGPWLVASVAFGYAGVGINEGPKTGPGGRLEFIRELTAHGFRELRRNWIDQFWGNFAWINTPYPDWVQGVILVAVLGGIGLVAVAAWRAVRNRRASRRALLEPVGDPEDVLTVGVICLTSVAVTGAGLLWLMWQFFKKVGTFELVQGRNALMLVPAVIALPVMALRYLRPRLSPSIPLAVIAGSMIALNIIGLDLVIERFYL